MPAPLLEMKGITKSFGGNTVLQNVDLALRPREVHALLGSLIMGLLSNGCNLLGVSPFLQQVIIGSVIVLAVTLDEYQRRKTG